jgi:CHRD domain
MKRLKTVFAFSLLASFLLPTDHAGAALIFTATLSGSQVLPAVLTTATGWVTVGLNEYPGQLGPVFLMDLQAGFSGLSSGWTTAGLYGPAIPGQTGSLLFNISALAGLAPPPGATSGTFAMMDQSLPPGMLDALNAGAVYFSLHSVVFSGGELRGQLISIPEPSAWALVSVAMLGLCRVRKRSSTV